MVYAFHCDVPEAAAFATSFADACCAACGDQRLSIFYAQAPQPCSGSALYSSARDALAAPRGAVDLARCEGCGVIQNLSFEQENWRGAASSAQAPGDHVWLDRVAEPRGYLAALREHLLDEAAQAPEGSAEARPVMRFAAPNAKAALEAGAFEDVHYARPIYYTPGALARTLREAGFVVERLTNKDGVVMATARLPEPGELRPAVAVKPLRGEETVAEVKALATEFARRAPERVFAWRNAIRAAGDRPVAFWGADARTAAFFSSLRLKAAAPLPVDPDARKHGAYLAGFETPIQSPEALRTARPELVIAFDKAGVDAARKAVKSFKLDAKVVNALAP